MKSFKLSAFCWSSVPTTIKVVSDSVSSLHPQPWLTCYSHLGDDGEPQGELVLQVGHRPEALELTVDHYGEPGAQGLALLHAVAGQDDALPGRLDLLYDLPEVPPGHRVHPGAGLVQEDHRGVAHQGHGHVQFAFVSSAVGAGLSVNVLLDAEEVGPPGHLPGDLVQVDPPDPGHQPQQLPARELRDDGVELGAVADLGEELPPPVPQFVGVDLCLALGGSLVSGQHPEGCCLPRSVDSQQSEALARLYSKADVSDGSQSDLISGSFTEQIFTRQSNTFLLSELLLQMGNLQDVIVRVKTAVVDSVLFLHDIIIQWSGHLVKLVVAGYQVLDEL